MAVRWVELTRAKRSARSVRRIGLTGSVAWDGPHALGWRSDSAGRWWKKIFLGLSRARMVAMGPQDTYVVKMEHLVTRTRVRGELAPSPGAILIIKPAYPRSDGCGY